MSRSRQFGPWLAWACQRYSDVLYALYGRGDGGRLADHVYVPAGAEAVRHFRSSMTLPAEYSATGSSCRVKPAIRLSQEVHPYTQPCPHCEQPAIYQERYPRAVCDPCLHRTTDRAGRRVTGFNIDLSGGMIAYYADTLEHSDGSGSQYEECVEVSRTGVCFIDAHPATMQEARFGGIVVQMASADGDGLGRPNGTVSRLRRIFRW